MNKKKLQTDFLKKLGGESLLQSVFNSFPDTHIFIKDLKGRHIFQNDLFTLKRGIARSEDIIGHTSYRFSPKSVADKYTEDDKQVFRTGEPIINREEKIYAKDGKPAWYSTTKVPLYDAKGNLIGLTGVARDITDHKQLVNKVNRQKRELEKMAIRDTLTNAHNRRFLEKNLANVYEIYLRMNKGSSLITFDLDHFKKVNDTYGHAVGDLVLKKFTLCVSGALRRKTDYLVRNGGDEFVLCLLGADSRFAAKMAGEIHSSLKKIKWPKKPFKGQAYSLCVSIGVATDDIGTSEKSSLENLLRRSDAAAYAAKKKGGDCVVCE